jgi:hypothetical protein
VIGRLVGTTKSTIDKVRGRTHWNTANLKASDPVTLGLCSQIDLDEAVEKATRAKSRAAERTGTRKTLRSAKETLAEQPEVDPFAEAAKPDAVEDEGDEA